MFPVLSLSERSIQRERDTECRRVSQVSVFEKLPNGIRYPFLPLVRNLSPKYFARNIFHRRRTVVACSFGFCTRRLLPLKTVSKCGQNAREGTRAFEKGSTLFRDTCLYQFLFKEIKRVFSLEHDSNPRMVRNNAHAAMRGGVENICSRNEIVTKE